MIDYIIGVITEIEKNKITINNHDIGYTVYVSSKTSEKLSLGMEPTLMIYDLIKEADHKLFGFLNKIDRFVFEFLLSTDGVGPSIAMKITDKIESIDILNNVADNNLEEFTNIYGVGSKVIKKISEKSKKAKAIIDKINENDNCEKN